MPKQLVAILAGLAVAAIVSFGLSFLLAANGAEPGNSEWVLGAVLGVATMTAMLSLSGNRKVDAASAEARAAALAFAPPAGQGLLIVFREGFVGKAQGIDISVDGRVVSQLKGTRFTALPLGPGRHRMEGRLTGAMDAHGGVGEAEFDLEAGATIVLRVTVKMGLTSGNVVATRVDDLAAAKTKLAKMPMVAAT